MACYTVSFNFFTLLPSCSSVLISTSAFRFRLTPLPERPSFQSSSPCLASGPIFPDVSLAPCHSCMAGHHSAGAGRLLPALCSGLRLDASPMPLPQCLYGFHCGIFLGDLPMLRTGLHLFSILLLALQTCLSRFLPGHCLFSLILHFCSPGFHLLL
jgi:hypothetical protein